jgi:hypothetical protein
MLIIDCLTDSIIKRVAPGGQLECMCLVPWSNRLYFVSTDYDSIGSFNILYVLDCQNDSVLSQMRLVRNAKSIACNPQDHRIYITDIWDAVLYVFRDEILGIEDRTMLEAKRYMPEIYPNPASSFHAVRLQQSADRQTLKIFDVSGKLIKEVEILRSAQNDGVVDTKISLKGINPGIYFLQFGTRLEKFLVVK